MEGIRSLLKEKGETYEEISGSYDEIIILLCESSIQKLDSEC